MQLLKTLDSLLQLLANEVHSDGSSFGIAYTMALSGKLALLDMYACSETNHGMNSAEETQIQAIAMEQFQSTAIEAAQFSKNLQLSDYPQSGALSPLMCDCFYQSAAGAAWYFAESGSEQMAQTRDALVEILQAIEGRWKSAG